MSPVPQPSPVSVSVPPPTFESVAAAKSMPLNVASKPFVLICPLFASTDS